MDTERYPELVNYSEQHTSPEPEVLARLYRETHLTQVYPQMLSGHLQGTLLRMFCQMIKPRRVLEIGTFTGYSAIAMGLGGMPSPPAHQKTSPPVPLLEERGEGATKDGGVDDEFILHTIEVCAEFEAGIRRYINEAGLEDWIVLHIGEALKIIPTLDGQWDMVFIDADKPNYLNYYNMVLPQVRTGGFIIADNVLWDGKVLGDPSGYDKDTRGIAEFNTFVQQDDRVENLMLPIRDGLMVVRKVIW